MTAADFISFVKKECKYYGVKCILRRSAKLRDEHRGFCAGYFDDHKLELSCAMKHPHSIMILAHEFCHMRQWAEKADIWVLSNDMKSYDVFGKFLKGGADIGDHLDIIRDVELDNEKRTVRLIKELSLPIDHREYTKRANLYIQFHNWMKITGKWGTKSFSQNKRLLALVPDKFSMNYSKLPKRLETAFREEGI